MKIALISLVLQVLSQPIITQSQAALDTYKDKAKWSVQAGKKSDCKPHWQCANSKNCNLHSTACISSKFFLLSKVIKAVAAS